jgi:hypothetical protein
MARRGSKSFRRNDGLRAPRMLCDGGLEPTTMDIVVGTDGTVSFRVYGEKAAEAVATETAAATRERVSSAGCAVSKAPKKAVRRRKPTLRAALAAAAQAGKTVKSATIEDGKVTLVFGEPTTADASRDEWDEALNRDKN